MPGIGNRSRRRVVIVSTLIAVGCLVGAILARSAISPGELDQALAAYQRGDWAATTTLAGARLKGSPDDPRALRLLARSAARRRDDRAARALYSRLGGPSMLEAEDFYLLGTALERSGDPITARECWATGLLADPSHPELILEFIRLSFRDGQPDRASLLARRLETLPGWAVRGGLKLGEIELARDEPAEAAAALKRALDHDPTARNAPHPAPWYRKLLARALLRTGQHAEAAGQLRTVLATEPDSEAFWLLSRSALQAGSLTDALKALGRSGTYGDDTPTAPDPAPYVGASRCAGCHPTFYRAEQNSLHARTFHRATGFDDARLPRGPVADPARPEVRHTLARSGGDLRYEARVDGETSRAVVEYIFGSGKHGQTLVGRDGEGHAREFRLSHYADGSVWDVTTGHPKEPPPGEGYLGRLLTTDDLRGCLHCHTTVARSALKNAGPVAADRGIGCERCHGPGGNHLKAVAVDFPDLAIARPRLGSAAEVVALCGQCHSPVGKTISPGDPFAVRFPASGLTWSRCYTEGNGKLDCRTCHDPHKDAETAPAFYESKCLACHSPESTATPGGTPCPVNPSRECLSCHMPTVRPPIPHSSFTDHHIRIHRGSAGNRQAAGAAVPD